MEAVGVVVNKIGDTITIEKKEGDEEGNTTSTAVGTTPTPDEIHHEDEVEDMSENESEGTQPEEVRTIDSNVYLASVKCTQIIFISGCVAKGLSCDIK